MKKIVFEAECIIPEKMFKKLIKEPKIVWDSESAIGMVGEYPIKIVGAKLCSQ